MDQNGEIIMENRKNSVNYLLESLPVWSPRLVSVFLHWLVTGWKGDVLEGVL